MTDPLGYTYEADSHCVPCTEKRFGDNLDDAIDREGNPIHPIAPWDEQSPAGEWCGSCGAMVDSPWPECSNADLTAFGVDRETYEGCKKIAQMIENSN